MSAETILGKGKLYRKYLTPEPYIALSIKKKANAIARGFTKIVSIQYPVFYVHFYIFIFPRILKIYQGFRVKVCWSGDDRADFIDWTVFWLNKRTLMS